MEAAVRGDLAALMLVTGDINRAHDFGQTYLHAAATEGHVECVVWLLSQGADANAATHSSRTALHFAASNGHTACVRALVEAGADPNARAIGRQTPLHYAAKGPTHSALDCVRILLDAGADVWARAQDESLAAHYAAGEGNDACAAFLASLDIPEPTQGASNTGAGPAAPDAQRVGRNPGRLCNARNRSGRTVLHVAAEKGNAELCRVLCRVPGIDANARAQGGETPLHFAAHAGSIDCCRVLITEGNCRVNARAEDGRTPAHVAAAASQAPCLEWLIVEAGSDVSARTADGRSVTDCAQNSFMRRHAEDVLRDMARDRSRRIRLAELQDGELSGKVCSLRWLMDNVDSNEAVLFSDDSTPLHVVCASGRRECVDYILGNLSANIDHLDGGGRSPLYYAVRAGQLETVKQLVSKGARVNALSGSLSTMLHAACEAPSEDSAKCIEYLLSLPALRTAAAAERRPSGPLVVPTAPEARVFLSARRAHRDSASLSESDAKAPNAPTPFDLGAWDIDMPDIDSIPSPDDVRRRASWASSRSPLGSTRWECVDIDVDAEDIDGATALALACGKGADACVLALLRGGANPASMCPQLLASRGVVGEERANNAFATLRRALVTIARADDAQGSGRTGLAALCTLVARLGEYAELLGKTLLSPATVLPSVEFVSMCEALAKIGAYPFSAAAAARLVEAGGLPPRDPLQTVWSVLECRAAQLEEESHHKSSDVPSLAFAMPEKIEAVEFALCGWDHLSRSQSGAAGSLWFEACPELATCDEVVASGGIDRALNEFCDDEPELDPVSTLPIPRTRLASFLRKHLWLVSAMLGRVAMDLRQGFRHTLSFLLERHGHAVPITWRRTHFMAKVGDIRPRGDMEALRADRMGRVTLMRSEAFESTVCSPIRRMDAHALMRIAVSFADEPGHGDGVTREGICLALRALADPAVGLFESRDGGVTLHPSLNAAVVGEDCLPAFEAFGRLLAVALVKGVSIPLRLSIPFVKHLMGLPLRPADMADFDEELYNKKIRYILENDVTDLGLTFAESFRASPFLPLDYQYRVFQADQTGLPFESPWPRHAMWRMRQRREGMWAHRVAFGDAVDAPFSFPVPTLGGGAGDSHRHRAYVELFRRRREMDTTLRRLQTTVQERPEQPAAAEAPHEPQRASIHSLLQQFERVRSSVMALTDRVREGVVHWGDESDSSIEDESVEARAFAQRRRVLMRRRHSLGRLYHGQDEEPVEPSRTTGSDESVPSGGLRRARSPTPPFRLRRTVPFTEHSFPRRVLTPSPPSGEPERLRTPPPMSPPEANFLTRNEPAGGVIPMRRFAMSGPSSEVVDFEWIFGQVGSEPNSEGPAADGWSRDVPPPAQAPISRREPNEVAMQAVDDALQAAMEAAREPSARLGPRVDSTAPADDDGWFGAPPPAPLMRRSRDESSIQAVAEMMRRNARAPLANPTRDNELLAASIDWAASAAVDEAVVHFASVFDVPNNEGASNAGNSGAAPVAAEQATVKEETGNSPAQQQQQEALPRAWNVPLVAGGEDVAVTEANKRQFVDAFCLHATSFGLTHQLDAAKRGFNALVPEPLVQSLFGAYELRTVLFGDENEAIDVEDWRASATFPGRDAPNGDSEVPGAVQCAWFWDAVRSLTNEQRVALLQFCTGASRPPFGGFCGSHRGAYGPSSLAITMNASASPLSLPESSTCFSQLKLPYYRSYEELRERLVAAITHGCVGFDMA